MLMNFPLVEFPDEKRQVIPRTLYRRFDQKEHAELFLRYGEMRFGNLQKFREYEGTRGDPHEGKCFSSPPEGTIFELRKDGLSECDMTGKVSSLSKEVCSPWRYFIYCMSYDKTECQVNNFGPYLVTINDTQKFIERITSGVLSKRHMCWGKVEYPDDVDFSVLLLSDKDHYGRTPIWMVKQKQYNKEIEFRLSIIADDCKLNEYYKLRYFNADNFTDENAWRKALTLKILADDLRDIASLSIDE